MAAARRVAVSEARKRAAAADGRKVGPRRDTPGGLLLTTLLVIAVLVGTLALMFYRQSGP